MRAFINGPAELGWRELLCKALQGPPRPHWYSSALPEREQAGPRGHPSAQQGAVPSCSLPPGDTATNPSHILLGHLTAGGRCPGEGGVTPVVFGSSSWAVRAERVASWWRVRPQRPEISATSASLFLPLGNFPHLCPQADQTDGVFIIIF